MGEETADTDMSEDSDAATVAEWVADRCVPMATTDPERGTLAPLRETFADRTVVGLGEATHGAREFFQVKHRLIRLLVEACDCRVVAFEAGFSAARAIDEYVTHGEGDPRDALAELHAWPLRSDAVLALVRWLRSFNDGRPPGDRVRVVGVDAQHTDRAARSVRNYLKRVDPDYLTTIENDLDTLAEGLRYSATDIEELRSAVETTVDTVVNVEDRLTDRRETYVDATTPEAYEVAVGHARTLRRAHELAGALARGEEDAWAIRERSMADAVAWALDHVSSPVVLWAHDDHVKRAVHSGTEFPRLGKLLADRYGDGYYALGSEFDHGSFRAHAASETDREGISEWRVDPLSTRDDAADTVAAAFDAVDAPAAVLDFDRARHGPLAEWLDTPHERRNVGLVYRDERQTTTDAVGDRFDGLVFVRETTAARLLGGPDE